MKWMSELELVRLLRRVMVSVDETWDIGDMSLDAVFFLVLLCGLSVLSYFLDIYHLVKRKTMTETMIGMLLPGMAATFGAVWLTQYGNLPSRQVLDGLAKQPFSLALSVQLTACAVLFAAVFVMTRLCLRKKWQEEGTKAGGTGEGERTESAKTGGTGEGRRTESAKTGGTGEGGRTERRKTGKAEWRWIAAYAIDFLTALMAFAAGCYGMFTNLALHRGKNLFAGSSVLYGIFLYLLPFLLFKTVLLLLLLLLRVYGAGITLFPYRQGMHAGLYLYRWLLLYHCPLLREVMVFSLVTGLILLKAAGGLFREDALLGAALFGILTAGYLWAAVRRSTAPLRKFRRWRTEGSLNSIDGPNGVRHLKEQFCREYFCEEPLFRDAEYTLTRNFLVEEKNSAGIFYLGGLRYLPRGWIHDGKKWIHVVIFRDGSKISLEKGRRNSEEVFRGIERYAKSYGIAESRAMADGITKTQKVYTDTLGGQVLAVCTVAVLLILTVVLTNGLGAWG